MKSLCKDCRYRFRRVFIPSNVEDYFPDDSEAPFFEEESILITNVCLLSGMDLEDEVTVECNSYKDKAGELDAIPFFKRL